MAKTSVIVRNEKRAKLAKQYAERRATAKATMKSKTASPEEVVAAYEALQKIPRNASPVRYRNRCKLTGRGRAVLSKFGLCRNEFRRLAHMGQIVGVTKSSW